MVNDRFRRALDVLPEYIGYSRKDPNVLTGVITNLLDAARCGAVVDSNSVEVDRALRRAAQASGVFLAVAASPEKMIQAPLGDEMIQWKGKIDKSTVYPSKWILGFFLSCLCRDEQSKELLLHVPPSVLVDSPTKEPAYRQLLVDALRGFWLDEPDTGKRIIKAMEATDPERPDIRKPEWVLNLDVPLIELVFHIWESDADFGPALNKAVLLHKEYWSKTKDRRQDWDGYLPIELLGAAALAYDRKIPFEIDTEFLPQRLIRGEF